MSTTIMQFKSMLSSALALLLLIAVGQSAHAQQKPEQLAQKSAEAWLAMVDAGKSADSWDQASSFFKSAVTKDQWQHALGAARDPLGKLVSRKFKSATYTKTLPGAPDGEYVVIQYESSFANKPSATETITPMLDKDGRWRVTGYFIK